jgi:hypothetical protein
MQPGTLPLRAQRWTPFVYTIDFVGQDFTGATFAMDVRLRPDAPGSALIALAGASAPTQGISVTVATVSGVPTSSVEIRISEATLEGVLLNAGKAGADVVLAWDIHITFGGGLKTRWLQGSFTIEPGVTQ